MHPDSAWSPWYVAPAGLEHEKCQHGHGRHMRAFVGKKVGSLLVQSCGYCGRILRTPQPITWRQYDWVRRWNARIARS